MSDDEWDKRVTARYKRNNDIRLAKAKANPEYRAFLVAQQSVRRAALLKTIVGWAKVRLPTIRSAAKRASVPFDLTTDYLVAIFPADGLCPYLQQPMTLTGDINDRMIASVDRINPSLGYIQGNVRIISRRANAIKNDCVDPEVFRRIADQLERDLCAQYR